jgi:hypothetical protein
MSRVRAAAAFAIPAAMTPEQFRSLALALPDAVEGAHQGHPDFRAHGRVFASLHPDGKQAMVKVAAEVQQRLVAAAPLAFTPANGAWGRAGCTMVVLAAADATVVRDALADAWQQSATGKPAAAGRKAATARKPTAAKAAPKRPRATGR